MKFLIAVFIGCSAGALVGWLSALSRSLKRPSADFLTNGLRKICSTMIGRCRWGPVRRYLTHVTKVLEETPLARPMDVSLFVSLHLLCAVFGVIVLGFAMASWTVVLWLGLPVACGAGSAPYFWLLSQRKKFHRALLKSLPDCLDLLALVMEAGLDFSAGLDRYLEKGPVGPLKNLLLTFQKEQRMGRSRIEALGGLAEKTTFGPMREMARSLVQGLTLGTSLAPLMRGQAASVRLLRMQTAEKRAAEAPLKVLFPLFAFIFPTVFIVLFGPVALLFMKGAF